MTTEDAKEYLFKLFPDFSDAWNSKDNYFIEDNCFYTFHGLFMEFSWYFRDNIMKFSDEQLKDLFSNIEKWDMPEEKNIDNNSNDQLLSNAISTCFLEGIAGEGLTERIKKFMGKKSLEYYSHYDYKICA